MRVPIGFAALLAMASLLACGEHSVDLPDDQLWTGRHVRYHTRSGDRACSAITDTIDAHARLVFDAFGLELREDFVLDYYKYEDRADFRASGACPVDASACSEHGDVWAPRALDRHELVHAYFSGLGRSSWLLSEGIAVALSCDDAEAPRVSVPKLDEAFAPGGTASTCTNCWAFRRLPGQHVWTPAVRGLLSQREAG